ncbi:MAG TPA: hypothetical protein VM580_27185 [Labilithrix sp.]|nr:hypothetical protein [Labilithrix sp.]
MRLAHILAVGVVLAGCGYRPVHDVTARERYAVVLASSSVADAVASDEVVAGVRDALARSGALAIGESYPRCEVEVLRADEASEGVAATSNPDGVLVPEARATRVGVVARAWIVRSNGGLRERDTGDVRALEIAEAAPDARTATFRHADAIRAAGRRVGRRMGARLLGLPSASD